MIPLLSDKSKSDEKLTLVEDIKIINKKESNKEFLNSGFSNAVKNLQIPEFSDINLPAERIFHSIFKAILKYKDHPSILAINNLNNNSYF